MGSARSPGVVLVNWPEHADQVTALAQAGLPRLLLVANDADPPASLDASEDWVRLPADERDIAARVQRLTRRAGEPAMGPPTLDGNGRLHHRGSWVALSPIEARMASALVERFGSVVSEDELGARGWPGGTWPPGALRVHLTRLRQRLAPLGLDVTRVRLQGLVLQDRPEGRASGPYGPTAMVP
jgi:DNA-binding response OmpR family regulator